MYDLSFRTAMHYKLLLLSRQKCQISRAKLVVSGTKYFLSYTCKCVMDTNTFQ